MRKFGSKPLLFETSQRHLVCSRNDVRLLKFL